jgi:hypothetical protein
LTSGDGSGGSSIDALGSTSARIAMWMPACVLLVTAVALLVARRLMASPGQGVDDWAYAAWGQGLAHGQAPVISVTGTAPKPLVHLLAVLAVGLPADRGMSIVVAVASAAMVAGVAVCALRLGNGLAMPVAVGSLLMSYSFGSTYHQGSVDAITAALLAWALALTGRWRVALLVMCGLVRPEAWPVAGVAGYLGSRGRRGRRLAIAAACTCTAPVIWAATDYSLSDTPFAFLSVGRRIDRAEHIPPRTLTGLPSLVLHSVVSGVGVPLLVAGMAGLVVNAIRARRSGRLDPLPLVTVGVWASALAAEFFERLPPYARYATPVAAVLAIGAGLLAADLVPRRWIRLSTWPAVLVTILITVAWVLTTLRTPPLGAPSVKQVEASLPTIHRVLSCGKLGVLNHTVGNPSKLIPITAVLGHIPVSGFAPVTAGTHARYGAVMRLWSTDLALPSGVVLRTRLGPISLTPGCARKVAGRGAT